MVKMMKEINDVEDEESGFVVISLSTWFLISFVEDVDDCPIVVPLVEVLGGAGTLEY